MQWVKVFRAYKQLGERRDGGEQPAVADRTLDDVVGVDLTDEFDVGHITDTLTPSRMAGRSQLLPTEAHLISERITLEVADLRVGL